MKPHHISAVAAALILSAAVTGAPAQQQINSGQMATSLAGVSNTRLSLTGAQMRQAVLDNIRNYPGALPSHPLVFPQLENLAQFVVEVDFDFNSAVIKPSSYRTIGAIADALHNPILLGYGFLVIGHTDSVGGRQYNVGLSQRRAEAIRDALIDPFNVNPGVLEAVGMGEEQLRDPAHPTSGVNDAFNSLMSARNFVLAAPVNSSCVHDRAYPREPIVRSLIACIGADVSAAHSGDSIAQSP
jgi:OmpA-OmpF porin, OOP family